MPRTITREEYERLRVHDYAGTAEDGVWWLELDQGATTLVYGYLVSELACIECQGPIEPVLARLGSVTCSQHRPVTAVTHPGF